MTLCIAYAFKIISHLMNFFGFLLQVLDPFHIGRGFRPSSCPYSATIIKTQSFIAYNGSHIIFPVSQIKWILQDIPRFLCPGISLKFYSWSPSLYWSLNTLIVELQSISSLDQFMNSKVTLSSLLFTFTAVSCCSTLSCSLT